MDYRSVIESRYNRQNWQGLLHDIFRQRVQFWQQPQSVVVDESMAKRAYYTGLITLPDGHTIAIYEVELSDSVVIERNRAGIRNLLCTNWRGIGCTGAFMFCYRQDEAVLRFSYVSESYAFAEDGGIKKESTDTKRFTYLLGEGHRSRTAIKQFEELKKSTLDLKAITKAFSVEALSEQFFTGYKKQYEDIVEYVTGKRMVKVSNKWEEQVTGRPCTEIIQQFVIPLLTDGVERTAEEVLKIAEKSVRDYVKKLMGRLVFIQFLQKKGWMGCSAGDAWNDGDKEFIQNLFANSGYQNTFVDDVLEHLFNDINTRREGDLVSHPNVGTNIKVPYLNGGLFERDKDDDLNFPLPAKYMKSLLDFFASYNFTIDENDPDDAEIGVDPEMLGRIFENLLEDNKDKGAFYTPKEIVQYMCRESLIAYLQTDVTNESVKESIRSFVTTYDAAVLAEDTKTTVDQKLKDVKICDPAIGSGAFPMGLLRELYACRKAIEGIDQETAVNIKTHIIQNNIYGVDIEKGAVDIARLRFWLALIVDEKNPHALPNMDFKIMQGNSLLEQYNIDDKHSVGLNDIVEKNQQIVTRTDETLSLFKSQDVITNLGETLHNYYSITDHEEKQQAKKSIDDCVREYIRIKIRKTYSKANQVIERNKALDKLSTTKLISQDFFLWHTWFSDVFEKGGFDIVIGNPPYVESRNSSIDDKQKDAIQKQIRLRRSEEDSDCFPRGADLLVFFFELSFSLCSPSGVNTFITENSWLSTDYGLKFQKFILKNINTLGIIDSDYKYFENADINTVITFFENKGNREVAKVPFIHCHGDLSIHPYKLLEICDDETITVNEFDVNDQILSKQKWGFLFSIDNRLLEVLNNISKIENKDFRKKISIGQGLNLTKDCILNQPSDDTSPFFTSLNGPLYRWNSSEYFVENSRVSSTRKKPLLILPRGLGTHFCCFNEVQGYSTSYVEIYETEALSKREKLQLWVFCNSSLCWVLREFTGRCNLGGGMLKAEATDLKKIPLCFDFKNYEEMESIFELCSGVQVPTKIDSAVDSEIHRRIDKIVFNYFGLSEDCFITSILIDRIHWRTNKSKNKKK